MRTRITQTPVLSARNTAHNYGYEFDYREVLDREGNSFTIAEVFNTQGAVRFLFIGEYIHPNERTAMIYG